MAKLLDTSGIRADTWTVVEPESEPAESGPALYPVEVYRAHRDSLPAESGIWVDADAEPEDFADLIAEVPVIAIRFGAFTDGRGLSLAVLLRNRYAFRGDLRAIGSIHEDIVHYMHRCAFTSYVLDDERDLAVAQRALVAEREAYQGSVLQPEPAFRRLARS